MLSGMAGNSNFRIFHLELLFPVIVLGSSIFLDLSLCEQTCLLKAGLGFSVFYLVLIVSRVSNQICGALGRNFFTIKQEQKRD